MNEPIHIAGDGVAGLALAVELQSRGAEVVVHGDRRAHAPIFTLVHRYAGRSFRTTDFDDRVWHAAVTWLDQLVEAGVATRVPMTRPRTSAAGDRLAGSLEHAENVTLETVGDFGECFVYEPAFVVDVAAALNHLARQVPTTTERRHHDAVIAVGAALEVPGVDIFGGQLARFDGELDVAVSGGGIHAVPTTDGICVGSTWWPADEPIDDALAAADLRERATRLGLDLGRVRHIWRGFRCVYQRDRRPLVGVLGQDFVIGAFGSRGWYWAAYAAQQAGDALLHGSTIDPEISATRCRV